MARPTKKTKEEPVLYEPAYNAEHIIQANQYRPYIDLLTCLLDEGGKYTLKDVDTMIQEALQKEEIKVINE